VRVARSFQPMTTEERDALLARTKQAGAKGEFEGFKTSSTFDATERNQQWLSDDS